MKFVKRTFLICLGLMLLLPGSLYAQQPSGPQFQTKAAAQGESSTLGNTTQMTDIHDIKPLEKIGFNPALLGYAALGAVILALLLTGFFIWKKRQKQNIPQIVAKLSPEETALNSLAELQDLMHANGKQFYFRLSMVLREYIRDRFGLDAPEMTTEELLPRIAEIKLGSDLDRQVRDFVLASDPVKFAGQSAEMESMEQHFEFVRDFVKKTTPVSGDELEIAAADRETDPLPAFNKQ